ncbi:MAG: winged helix-turn-helix transcriptional regulator [Candidatus Thorarchaeota archaeon]
MDPLDWAFIRELSGDARMSYQALARRFSVSPNTVKNRISKLVKQGVIRGFGVIVSMEMLGAEHIAGASEIYRTSDRRYEYWAMVKGASETLGFKRFLEEINSVIDVEMRPVVFLFPNKPPSFYLNTRGKKVTLTQSQLRVLRCLIGDARMPVSQIAQRAGLTPRRVRKNLRDLQEGGGIHFMIGYDIFALGDMEYRLKIRFDEAQTTGQDIIEGLYEKYPDEFWWASVTTNEGKGVPIIREIKAAPFTQSVEDFGSYPRVIRANNPLAARLEELLIDAGI